MKLLSFLFIPMVIAQAYGDNVHLDWVGEGFSSKVDYYRPIRVDLSATKPARVTQMPADISNPLFGTIYFGPGEAPVEVNILLDEPANGAWRIWVDSNGNGDLTDDPPVQWTKQSYKDRNDAMMTRWSGSAGISVSYGNDKRTLGIRLYGYDSNDPQLKNTLFFCRDYGLLGTLTLDGKTVAAALIDDGARGDFSESLKVRLFVDPDNTGKFKFRDSFDVHKPFAIGGTTYEINELTAPGDSFQLVKSSQTAAATPVPPVVETGPKEIAFEEPSTTGQTIRFPADYRGKLVMIDFWATWCGPCRKEAPNLANVYAEFHARGFEVIGVSLDSEQSRSKIAPFTTDKQMPWPQICDGNGWEAKLVKQYGVRSIPSAWLIDGTTGLIVAMGGELRGEKLRPTVERCLSNLGKPAAISPTAKSFISQPPADIDQGVGVPSLPATDAPLIAKARELAKAGNLLTSAEFNPMLQVRNPAARAESDPGLIIADDKMNLSTIVLPAAATQPLSGREIAARAAQAYVRVGWIYHCSLCHHWHVRLAGGYAISKDTIVTAFHVLRPPDAIEQGEGYPVVIRGNDQFLPIVSVLAADATTDAIILRVAATDLQPLAFSANAQVGDGAYCLSDPRGVAGYFSNGIINRFYTRPGGSAANPADQRFNVSTDWAPGSSGAAILDEYANVIGHVAAIQPLLGAKSSTSADDHGEGAAPTIMTLHEAVPARSILKLIEETKIAIATK